MNFFTDPFIMLLSHYKNVTRSFINKYNPECDVVDCYVCRIAYT